MIDQIIAIVRQHRDVDEEVFRLRWNALDEDLDLEDRVETLLGSAGPLASAVMRELTNDS